MTTVCIGIDLGTCNHCVCRASVDGATFVPEIIEGFAGENPIPSQISFQDNDVVIVGQPAESYMLTEPESTVVEVKRLLGGEINSKSVICAKENVFYKIQNERKCPRITLKNDGQQKSFIPEEIEAVNLNNIKNLVSNKFSKDNVKYVISVPAMFNQSQRAAVLRSAQIANLGEIIQKPQIPSDPQNAQLEVAKDGESENVQLINEHLAAALSFKYNNAMKNGYILIFDFGGGYMNCSIFTLSEDSISVLASCGEVCGGEDIDNILMNHFVEKLKLKDLQPMKKATLKRKCENLKKQLSFAKEAVIEMPELEDQAKTYEMKRDEFAGKCKDVIDSIKTLLKRTLYSAKLSDKNISSVLMVGGSTSIPFVKETIASVINSGKAPILSIDSSSIAIGAAIACNLTLPEIRNQIPPIHITDILSVPIGIFRAGNEIKTIFDQGCQMPCESTATVKIINDDDDDNQKIAIFKLFQGFGDKYNKQVCSHQLIGEYKITQFPPELSDATEIEITFKLSENGMLSVFFNDEKIEPLPFVEKGVMQNAIDHVQAISLRSNLQRELEDLLDKLQSVIRRLKRKKRSVDELVKVMEKCKETPANTSNQIKEIIELLNETLAKTETPK